MQRALQRLEDLGERPPLAGRAGDTVMLEPYPRAADFALDEAAERETAWIQRVVLGVRQIRGEMNISPAKRIPVLLKDASAEDEAYLARHRTWLERLAGVASITLLAPAAEAPQSAMALAGTLTILVPMAGLIDPNAEAERLGRLLARAQADLEKTRERLANDSFVRNAPEHVVAAERERAAELERTATGLAAQLERLRGLKP